MIDNLPIAMVFAFAGFFASLGMIFATPILPFERRYTIPMFVIITGTLAPALLILASL